MIRINVQSDHLGKKIKEITVQGKPRIFLKKHKFPRDSNDFEQNMELEMYRIKLPAELT